MKDVAWYLGAACLVVAACGDDASGTGGGGGATGASSGDPTSVSSGNTASATSSGSSSSTASSASSGGDGGGGTGANGAGGEGTGANGSGGEGTGANGTGGEGTGANGTGGEGTGGSGTGGDGSGGGGTGGGGDSQRLLVPGGDFLRQNDADLPASVSPFYLDRHELTVARFRAYYVTLAVDAQAALSVRFAACDGATWTDVPGDNEELPINCLARVEGEPACEAVGGRLPTELEWNFAAAGGDEQRVYPWSDPPDSEDLDATRAVYSDSNDDGMQPVGSRPAGAGRFGHLDLAGNVWEMMADSDNGEYETDATCDDCSFVGLPSEPRYVRRGGNVDSNAGRLRNDSRDGDSDDQDADIGVRCAYDSL